MVDGADDGATLFTVLLFIVGDLEGDVVRAEVAMLDSLLLILVLLPVVVFVDLDLLAVAAACLDDDIRNNGLATALEWSNGFLVHCITAKLAYPPVNGHADSPYLPRVSFGWIVLRSLASWLAGVEIDKYPVLVMRLFVTDRSTFFVIRSVPASPEAIPNCIPLIKPPICNE